MAAGPTFELAGYAYDAVALAGIAHCRAREAAGSVGKASYDYVLRAMEAAAFKGASGYLGMDEFGDRSPNSSVITLRNFHYNGTGDACASAWKPSSTRVEGSPFQI